MLRGSVHEKSQKFEWLPMPEPPFFVPMIQHLNFALKIDFKAPNGHKSVN